jgi:hypothetical protein
MQVIAAVFNRGAKCDVEKPAGLCVCVEREQQALVGGLVEEECFATLHVVDAPDITAFHEAAEARLERVDLIKALACHAARGGFLDAAKTQAEGRVHRIVREVPRVVDGKR